MTIAAIAASTRRTEVYRVTADGLVEHRWLDTSVSGSTWTDWRRAPFVGIAMAVAAISGWDQHIEIFVLDADGKIWNRWWWHEKGWQPASGFNLLGTPFAAKAHSLSVLNAGSGHFDVFVESAQGQLAVLPHVSGPNGPYWRRCPFPNALNDGWWPAFDPLSTDAYRRADLDLGPTDRR